MNTIQQFEARQLDAMTADKNIPDFSPGDTVKVNVKVIEGTRERIQAYEGVCIAKSGSGLNASFTVRKISLGAGVERVFPLYSPRLESIELVRRGSVRRAKLYYLRDRRGKSARIAERTGGHGIEAREEVVKERLTKEEKKARKAEKKAQNKAKAEEAKKAKAAAKEAEKAENAEGGE